MNGFTNITGSKPEIKLKPFKSHIEHLASLSVHVYAVFSFPEFKARVLPAINSWSEPEVTNLSWKMEIIFNRNSFNT